MSTRKDPGFDPEVYRAARSPRPAWATTLIVALVIFIAGIAVSLLSAGLTGFLWTLAAVVVCLAIAGIQALSRVKK